MGRPASHLICAYVLAATCGAPAATYFVAPDGEDGSPGTIESPFATWGKAQSMVEPGDTVLFRGGTYAIRSDTDSVGILLDKTGNPEKSIYYWAYGNETPVFDFEGMEAASRITGILVTASYLHLKGMELRGVPQRDLPSGGESWGLRVSGGLIDGVHEGGSRNIFERLDIHHNMGTGLCLSGGFTNLVLNCDSHHNFDPFTYVDGVKRPGASADGFAAHLTNSFNMANSFRGCRAWSNSDAGFDAYGSNSTVYFDTCWAWSNGYAMDTVKVKGTGDGFKMGGYDKSTRLTIYCACVPAHSVRFSLAFQNGKTGFSQNLHLVANHFYNNTAFRNSGGNFNGTGWNGNNTVESGVFRNNLSIGSYFSTGGEAGGLLKMENNSWNLAGLKVDSLDFQSLDTLGVSGPRQPDGRLPVLPFLRLAPGSDLIDKGMDLKFPYTGSAPDLGAFEAEIPTRILRSVPKARRPAGVVGNVGKMRDAGIDAAGRRKADAERARKGPGSNLHLEK